MKRENKLLAYSSLALFFISLITFIFLARSQNNNKEKTEYNSNVDKINVLTAQTVPALRDEILVSRRNAITKAIEEVSDAVVGINVTEIQKIRDPFWEFFGDDPYFKQFFGDRSYTREVHNLGSGVIISPDGYILSNDHVAGNAAKIVVTMTNGKKYDAKLIGSDKASDVCVLKIDETNLPYVKIGNSEDLIVGEWVIALGNPFGLFEINDKPTVTVGVISAVNMNLGAVGDRYYLNMIQTDAAINSGNSGGPLVNALGELIGINTLIYTAGSQGNIGVGFALPINKVMKIYNEIKQYGEVRRNFRTGIIGAETITEQIANYYNLPVSRGVIVTRIAKNSPAEEAGFQIGDIIIKVDRFRVVDEKSLLAALFEFRINDIVEFTIVRGKETKKIKLKLEAR